MLAGRRVVLGVSGGIAAYKAPILARALMEGGAAVRTVMTPAATRFLGARTLTALTGHETVVGLFAPGTVSPHTELARWADLIVVAPATAATLARLANGLSADALSATVLAFSGPVVAAPAMHTAMWEHPATRDNVRRLEEHGVLLVGPRVGPLAGGDEGPGRMAEPDEILAVVDRALGPRDLEGWRVVVDAGGTREPIDPVRFIGNRSSGKMGHAVAVAAARRGAEVTLVTTAEPPAEPGITVVSVETAAEMASEVWARAENADVAVLAAAVADFRPRSPSTTKLRRRDGPEVVELEPTPDILGGIAQMPARPFLVGFAAQVGDVEGAVDKAREKGVDLLVANDVTRPGAGFGTDTNEVVLVTPDGQTEVWPLAPKIDIAHRLWDRIVAERRVGGES